VRTGPSASGTTVTPVETKSSLINNESAYKIYE
jgi:hypothetical protein